MENVKVEVMKIEEPKDRMKGMATIVIDNKFAIHDIRIIEGRRGLFVAMPSRRVADGSFKDIVHPVNQETRELIEKTILEEFNK